MAKSWSLLSAKGRAFSSKANLLGAQKTVPRKALSQALDIHHFILIKRPLRIKSSMSIGTARCKTASNDSWDHCGWHATTSALASFHVSDFYIVSFFLHWYTLAFPVEPEALIHSDSQLEAPLPTCNTTNCWRQEPALRLLTCVSPVSGRGPPHSTQRRDKYLLCVSGLGGGKGWAGANRCKLPVMRQVLGTSCTARLAGVNFVYVKVAESRS